MKQWLNTQTLLFRSQLLKSTLGLAVNGLLNIKILHMCELLGLFISFLWFLSSYERILRRSSSVSLASLAHHSILASQPPGQSGMQLWWICSLHFTLDSVQFVIYSVQCALYSALCWGVHCIVWIVQVGSFLCAFYSGHLALCRDQSAVCSKYSIVCSVYSTENNMHSEVCHLHCMLSNV